jgi:hypothetical protein
MIIDQATWQSGGEEAGSFWEVGEAPIRGRRATETLYALPHALPA